MTSDDRLRSVQELPWYYTAELAPGVFSKGHDHASVAVTRMLLRGVHFQGRRCLDVGTAEGLVPILLSKQGAGEVVATDRADNSEKIAHLKDAYEARFEYHPRRQIHELPSLFDAAGDRFFDLVICSGVLYHMINPLGYLALLRGLCRRGGLFLLETAAIQLPEETLVFNSGGRFYGTLSNYFVPTTAWVDYALRMLGLRPLHAAFLGGQNRHECLRLAVLCRSEPAPVPLDPEDDWVNQPFHDDAFRNESQVDWDRLAATKSDISCDESMPQPVSAVGDRSLYEVVAKGIQHRPKKDELRLSLDSTL